MKLASFLKSEEVGINTLACLILLLISNNNINHQKFHKILKACIINNRVLLNESADAGLLNGATGYLYVLLTLEEQITERKLND